MNKDALYKYNNLLERLKKYKKVAVLLSGGLDSSFLLYSALNALGREKVTAITVIFPYTIQKSVERAIKIAKDFKINHKIIKDTSIMNDKDVANNTEKRCYKCKRKMIELATGVTDYKLIDGTNIDDMLEHRPGIKALNEFKIESPLAQEKIRKSEIKLLAKHFNLSFWNFKPNTCLLTRFPRNMKIKIEDLRKIEKVEEIVTHNTGIEGIRARFHGDLIRIESKENVKVLIDKLLANRKCIEEIKKIGFKFVTIELGNV